MLFVITAISLFVTSYLFLTCRNVEEVWKEIIVYYTLIEIRDVDWTDIHVGLSGS